LVVLNLQRFQLVFGLLKKKSSSWCWILGTVLLSCVLV